MNNTKITPFEFDQESSDFEVAFIKNTGSLLDLEREKFIPDQSIQFFRHGNEWHTEVNTADGIENEIGTMQSHSMETQVHFDDIIGSDLGIIERLQRQIVTEFMDGLQRSVYKTISDSTEKSGNIVNAASAGISADHFLEMLEIIEFGVDHEGEPTIPEIHGSPQVIDQFLAELSAQDSDFQSKVESIKARKINEALEKEQARLSKFPVVGR